MIVEIDPDTGVTRVVSYATVDDCGVIVNPLMAAILVGAVLGATFLAGLLAILFWFALKICPSLWMFFLWMLLFGIYFAAKLYGVVASRFPPSFWQDVVVNLLILLGPAVEDSATGKDPYEAFAVRFSLFVAVTLYAWLAIVALEWLRARRRGVMPTLAPAPEEC